jgi:competence protein ComEC
MSLKKLLTRFRAYQLGCEGSSFSYFDGSTFTLIEARLNDKNTNSIFHELKCCNKSSIDVLHITSWDIDHCNPDEFQLVLKLLKPSKIEYPGYSPHTDSAKESLEFIIKYEKESKRSNFDKTIKIQKISPEYIKSLDEATKLGYRDIFYNPKTIYQDSNNNSTVTLYRTGSFNVASLGDVEDAMISARLRRCKIFSKEIDVMILAHHGARNGFTSSTLIKAVMPTVAVCSSNYDNQFEHPKQEIRDILNKYRIPIFTTKTGDVIINSVSPHTHEYEVFNFIKDGEVLSSKNKYVSKKSKFLRHNIDTIRNIYNYKEPFYKKPIK